MTLSKPASAASNASASSTGVIIAHFMHRVTKGSNCFASDRETAPLPGHNEVKLLLDEVSIPNHAARSPQP